MIRSKEKVCIDFSSLGWSIKDGLSTIFHTFSILNYIFFTKKFLNPFFLGIKPYLQMLDSFLYSPLIWWLVREGRYLSLIGFSSSFEVRVSGSMGGKHCYNGLRRSNTVYTMFKSDAIEKHLRFVKIYNLSKKVTIPPQNFQHTMLHIISTLTKNNAINQSPDFLPSLFPYKYFETVPPIKLETTQLHTYKVKVDPLALSHIKEKKNCSRTIQLNLI